MKFPSYLTPKDEPIRQIYLNPYADKMTVNQKISSCQRQVNFILFGFAAFTVVNIVVFRKNLTAVFASLLSSTCGMILFGAYLIVPIDDKIKRLQQELVFLFEIHIKAKKNASTSFTNHFHALGITPRSAAVESHSNLFSKAALYNSLIAQAHLYQSAAREALQKIDSVNVDTDHATRMRHIPGLFPLQSAFFDARMKTIFCLYVLDRLNQGKEIVDISLPDLSFTAPMIWDIERSLKDIPQISHTRPELPEKEASILEILFKTPYGPSRAANEEILQLLNSSNESDSEQEESKS